MTRQTTGFVLGIALFVALLLLPPLSSFHQIAERIITQQSTTVTVEGLVRSMQSVLALTALMVVWWLTEAIPLAATALLPAVLLPLLHVVGLHSGAPMEFTFANVVAHYASPVIFLFLGGFLLAAAMQKWGLDRRFALWLLTRGKFAEDSRYVLLGMMTATAFISMWISNTATTAMMLPLGVGILSFMGIEPGNSKIGTAVMLGIAWSASVGGMGTIIGTPPNGIALGVLNATYGDDPTFQRITFVDWMLFGVPYVILFIPLVWYVLLKVFPPEIRAIEGGKARLLVEYKQHGRLSRAEKSTIVVVLLAAILWLTMPLRNDIFPAFLAYHLQWLDEYAVGIFAGVLLFVIPVEITKGKFVLDWRDTNRVDWGVLILFGGGIALSDAMFKSGLGTWIASSFVGMFGSPSTIAMIVIVVLLIDFLTEITSNTAVTSMMVPIVISIAQSTGGDAKALTIACALAASMAFMLPVGTPPNALVYGSGYVKLKDMIRGGFILDILGWLFTTAVIVIFAWWLFGLVDLT